MLRPFVSWLPAANGLTVLTQLPQHLTLYPLLEHALSYAQTYCCQPGCCAQQHHRTALLWPAEALPGLRPLPSCSAASSFCLPASVRAAYWTAQHLAALRALGCPAHLFAVRIIVQIQASAAFCDNAVEQKTHSMMAYSQGIHACTTPRKLVMLRPKHGPYLLCTSSNRGSSLFRMRSAHDTCCWRPLRNGCTRLPPVCAAVGRLLC